MWILGEKGGAVNLSKAYGIYFDLFSESVKAWFGDSSFFNIKKFSNEDDARKYIADLAEKLNAEKN